MVDAKLACVLSALVAMAGFCAGTAFGDWASRKFVRAALNVGEYAGWSVAEFNRMWLDNEYREVPKKSQADALGKEG